MNQNKSLNQQIADMRAALEETAMEAARSRGQRYMKVSHVLYALYMRDGIVGRLLRGHGIDSADIRRLMGEQPNEPLKDGENPVPWVSARRIIRHANDPVEILRYVQGNDMAAGLLSAHGIGYPEHQPTREQVVAASHVGVTLAQTMNPGRGADLGVEYLAYVRLMLEAGTN